MKNKALSFAFSLLVLALGFTSCKDNVDVVGTSHDKVSAQNIPGFYTAVIVDGTTLEDYEYMLKSDGTGTYTYYRIEGGDLQQQLKGDISYTVGEFLDKNYGIKLTITTASDSKDAIFRDGGLQVGAVKYDKAVSSLSGYLDILLSDVPDTKWNHEDIVYYINQYKDTTVTTHQESGTKQKVDKATRDEYYAKYGSDPSWKEKDWGDGTYTFQYAVTIHDTTIVTANDTLGPKSISNYTYEFKSKGACVYTTNVKTYKVSGPTAPERGHTYSDRTVLDKEENNVINYKWGIKEVTNGRIFTLNLTTDDKKDDKTIRLTGYQKAKGECSIDEVKYTLVK